MNKLGARRSPPPAMAVATDKGGHPHRAPLPPYILFVSPSALFNSRNRLLIKLSNTMNLVLFLQVHLIVSNTSNALAKVLCVLVNVNGRLENL